MKRILEGTFTENLHRNITIHQRLKGQVAVRRDGGKLISGESG